MSGGKIGRVTLDAKEELGADEHGADRALDAGFKTGRSEPFAEQFERRVEIIGRERSAVGAME